MNTAAIKNYAIQARLNFRKLVTEKLNSLGIKADGTSAPTQDAGGAIVINGMPFPASIRQQRNQLLALVKREGFEHVVEAMAYTLFNRFCALRFMEVHDYLPQRVFTSSTGGDTPDLLANAIDAIGYLGLDSAKAAQLREMKLRGDQDQELYKQLILAQCNALAKPMPFLFEPAKDMTELLMPDNLLHSDSVVRDLVAGVPEQDWQEIEIVGWLYQFYISERKDQVIGNVQSKEDIPAATQIFTPEWIVQYMVDNSLGRLWLEVEPNSGLAGSMDYYIDTAEANPDFVPPKHEHLKSPEDITLIDPACGSGHILVYAFDLLFRIYEQRGYVARDIPALILKHNLYGIDIDGRAAQLASFALTMKARSKDRRFLDRGVLPQILEIVESNGIEVDQLFATGGTSETVSPFADPTKLIQDDGLLAVQKSSASDLSRLRELVRPLVRFFHDAKSYGSLLRVPESLAKRLPAIRGEIARLAGGSGLFDRAAIGQLEVLVRQAGVLARQYDVCVANPPYMGSFYQELKDFAKFEYLDSKSDLYSMFIERNLAFLGCGGLVGMITIPNWMFLSSFERLRKRVLDLTSVVALCHNGRGVWGSDFGSCSFVLRNSPDSTFVGTYHRLFLAQGEVRSNTELEARFHDSSGFPIYHASPGNFKKIPGSPVAYWASDAVVECFEDAELLSMSANVCEGMNTANNDLFVRQWQETPLPTIGFDGGSEDADSSGNKKWFPYEKGGDFRKWFGNLSHVVNWKNSGHAIKAVKTTSGATRANIRNEDCFFRPAITWTYISSSFFGVRERDPGAIFDGKGPSLFSADTERPHQLAMLCSKPATMFMRFLNPTLNFSVGSVSNLPLPREWPPQTKDIAEACCRAARADWDAYERSWDFQTFPLLTVSTAPTPTLESSYTAWITQNRDTIAQMKRLEEENNRLFIEAYGLADELTPDVPIEQITLTVNPAYRYGAGRTEEKYEQRFREDTMEELVSYAIGCMMGRYSLDKPGLILANQGETVEDYTRKVLGEGGDVADPETVRLRPDATASCFCCGKKMRPSDALFILMYYDTEHVSGRPMVYCESCREGKGDQILMAMPLPEFSLAEGLRRNWTSPQTFAIFLEMSGCFYYDLLPKLERVTFAPDEDGIIPILEHPYFEDDCTQRLVQFLIATYGKETLNENLDFLADALGRKNSETPTETIRRYLATKFFKDHLKTYKKRPIYWLVSSGKLRAFQALIYLHRYTPATLSRLRTSYLHELQNKMRSRMEDLAAGVAEATSTAAKNRLGKELATLRKQQVELIEFDEKLHHYADQRIALDLDDGVKHNYGLFGDLLAEVKAVTGGSEE